MNRVCIYRSSSKRWFSVLYLVFCVCVCPLAERGGKWFGVFDGWLPVLLLLQFFSARVFFSFFFFLLWLRCLEYCFDFWYRSRVFEERFSCDVPGTRLFFAFYQVYTVPCRSFIFFSSSCLAFHFSVRFLLFSFVLYFVMQATDEEPVPLCPLLWPIARQVRRKKKTPWVLKGWWNIINAVTYWIYELDRSGWSVLCSAACMVCYRKRSEIRRNEKVGPVDQWAGSSKTGHGQSTGVTRTGHGVM